MTTVSEARTEPWTIGTILRWATDDFRARNIESPRLDAEVLLAHALRATRTQLIIELMRELTPTELGAFRELVKRRRQREPVAYLLGTREFYGRSFRVDARVLVPRPDTETLVEVALGRTVHVSLSARVLDLCTGSGCVAITLARERPTTRVVATDASAAVLVVACENSLRLGAYSVAFVRGDLYADVASRFDIITANPPYIASAEIAGLPPDVAKFEPRVALDGGTDGLDFYRRITAGAPSRLVRGGALAVEVGAGQADAVANIMTAAGFVDVVRTRDYARIERVVSGIFDH
ncbi:peptide chain release factor N(5)-glutamine methyltransferase [soil metagenome]